MNGKERHAAKRYFEELHGRLEECEGFVEREMYIRLMGTFVMGWEARERYAKQEAASGEQPAK